MIFTQLTRQLALGLAMAFVATTATATPITFTTVFGVVPGPTPSAPGGPGGLAPDVGSFPTPAVLNGLEGFTNFAAQNLSDAPFGASANTGQVAFFQNGDFYVGGAGPAASNPLSDEGETVLGGPVVNNRAYAVFGTGRSDIVFNQAAVVSSALVQVRGTAQGLVIGGANPNPALGHSLPVGTVLEDADATLQIYTNLGLQVTTTVSNSAFEEIDFSLGAVVDGQTITGDTIARISLINEGSTDSAIVLGELTVTAGSVNQFGNIIPEPTSVVLLTLTSGLALVGRRVR